MTDMLRRQQAPIADGAWEEIERQARRTLKGNLSGRRLVDFHGPHGWPLAAVNLGTLNVEGGNRVGNVTWGLRNVLPLVEIRVPFSLGIWGLDDLERGAAQADVGPVAKAAREAAIFEEATIYRGFPPGGIKGVLESSPHPPVPLAAERSGFPESVELAVLAIQQAGIGGPFALVLGTDPYRCLMAGDPGLYPVSKRVRALASGGIHWSPALVGGAVLSCRGGDFEMTVGHDLAIGYKTHDTRNVELYFTESFTFRVLEPAASVALARQE
jgi:uncharacterized linocin/CFP29 family protein